MPSLRISAASSVLMALFALGAFGLSGCSSYATQAEQQAQADPDHKQLYTGSRIAHKGRGGADALRTIGRAEMKDNMMKVLEAQPQGK